MDMPTQVREIGERVGMTPIAWSEKETEIVIVFEQGPKLRFPKEIKLEAPKPTRKPRKAKK